jgi:hypothetical protein
LHRDFVGKHARGRSAGDKEFGYHIERPEPDAASILFGADADKPKIAGTGACGVAAASGPALDSRSS